MNVYNEEKIMQDNIETFGEGSIIQHGKLNNRIYLMKLDENDLPDIFQFINHLARENEYSKIICKVPSWACPLFISNGFISEAYIPDFFKGSVDAFFMSKFLNSDRILYIENEKLNEFSRHLVKNNFDYKVSINKDFRINRLSEEHCTEIAWLYKTVFKSYPFPIYNPDYIKETMEKNVQYFGIHQGKKLIALSSAEIDMKAKNAEMTDFATLPEYRGKNLSVLLLNQMEETMKNNNLFTLYTIARLNSIAMNRTFLKMGYNYAGTLIKNTNIAGEIESMNVMYKHIQ